MNENLVEIQNLTFTHENSRTIFDGINMQIPRGKITAVMGPSGTGKTTLLRLISGQLRGQSGKVLVDGQSVWELPRRHLYQLRKRMGMLFQAGGLFTHLTVYENVAFALREHTSLSEPFIRALVLIKLQMVGLRGAANLMPSQLSGGMARRIALARAVIFDPMLMLYDEPFTGQDPISLGVLVKLIRTLNDALDMTSIIVSHDVQETLDFADYIYVIVDKKVLGHGTPSEIKANQSENLQQFIQGLPDGPVPFDYPAPPIAEDFLE